MNDPGAPENLPGEAAGEVGVWAEFKTSVPAVVALSVLIVISLLALLAPLLSPQNPYDLSAIDVREGRQPPGAKKFSKIQSVSVKVTSGVGGKSGPTLDIKAARTSDQALSKEISIALVPVESVANAYEFVFAVSPGSTLGPLTAIKIDGLPKKAKLSAGNRLRFRNTWTLSADEIAGLKVTFAKPPTRLRFKVGLEGGAQTPLMTYWLGTDDQGRDMLSAILYGLRISLGVALTSVIVAVSLGTLIGLYAAYQGGRFDTIVMRLVDLQLSFPTILVALILLAVLGKGIGNVVLALIIVQWAFYARTARGIALAERRKEYVEAATSLSLGKPRIIIGHILPNCLPSLIVVATLQVGAAITLEATLSFLGLGLPVTQPSLGLLISNGFEYLLSGHPWISVMPGVALLVTVVAINLVGDELRDLLNPRLRR
jgi:peptide/nickel transport system permease protein